MGHYTEEWGWVEDDPPMKTPWTPKTPVTPVVPVKHAPVKHQVVPVKHVQSSRTKHDLTVEDVKLGGQRGGQARAQKLDPVRRKEIARMGAQAMWERRRAK